MIKCIWDVIDGRYVSTESIQRCWRKANILPKIWNVDIKNAVRRTSVPEKHKVVSKEVSKELCQLMGAIKLKENESSIDTSTFTAEVLGNHSFLMVILQPKKWNQWLKPGLTLRIADKWYT